MWRTGSPSTSVDYYGFLRRLVPAARLLADFGGDVAHIDELLVEQERPIEADRGQVGPELFSAAVVTRVSRLPTLTTS